MKNKTFLSIIFILFLFITFKAIIFNKKYISDNYYKEYSLYIVSKYKESKNMIAYNILLNNDKFIMKIYQNENIELEKYKNLKYGDILNITGEIIIPEYMNNPGEFNYKHYLYSNNIYGEINVNRINDLARADFGLKEKILSYIYNYKEYIGNIFKQYISQDNVELAKSIIYGESIYLDDELEKSFEFVGLSHVMAISGANITSIIIILEFVLSHFKFKEKILKIITLIVIIIYLIITGSSLSTLRAGIMASTSIIASLLKKKLSPLQSWILAVITILLYAPYSVTNIGCVLSFLATFGIITFFKPLQKITDKITNRIRIKWLKKVIEIIFLNIWLTISIQIMIIPIQINSFNIFSFTQILFNVIVSGIVNIIIILGAIFVLFSYIPIFNFLTAKLINLFISILVLFVKLFEKISLNISVMDLPVIVIILYYCIVFSFILKIYLKQFVSNREYKTNVNMWKRYSLVQITLIVFTILLLIINPLYFKYISSFVYFFNVGQGEMSYVKCGKNSIIVDIGSLKTNLAFNTLSNYFKMKNISYVDAIVISHMHEDHINGLEKYLEIYNVGIILYSKPPEESDVYLKFKEIVNKYNINAKEVSSEEIYCFGNIKIEVIFPKEELLNVKDNINANSLVCKINVKDKNIMYMGDATIDTEKQILEIYDLDKMDLLKVGHHGSKTSTTEEYIKKILPKYAVISAKKSYYNHPHESIIEILKKYNVNIYITEKMGAIKYNL